MNATRARILLIGTTIVSGLTLAIASLILAGKFSSTAHAAPIDPPAGYPKFNQSSMSVSPDLVPTGGATLVYTIKVINTGAHAATNVTVEDVLPANTSYNHDATSSVSPAPVYSSGKITWNGTVGFDSSVVIQFSVDVDPAFEGVLTNLAAIKHASLDDPFEVSAEALVTDDPFFEINKTSSPAVPGPDKPLLYTLTITNQGQDATGLPVTVSDVLPANTSF